MVRGAYYTWLQAKRERIAVEIMKLAKNRHHELLKGLSGGDDSFVPGVSEPRGVYLTWIIPNENIPRCCGFPLISMPQGVAQGKTAART
jgi:hypothetical protein